MRSKLLYITFLVIVISFPFIAISQCPINSLGQNPSTAFPVCGTNVFVQAKVNLCGGKVIPNAHCNTNILTDVNPYWYKFTCFEAGTLGFTIQPNGNSSDYDWQVFDITGHNSDDVYIDKALGVSSNWSQYYGNTGTTTSARNIFECDSKVPQYSKMPTLIKGHEYLLLVSHFTENQEGYKLNFGGGTASITDTTKPALKTIEASCDGKTLGIKLNKRMKCKSLATDGSDFKLEPAVANIIGAISPTCSGFDMDSVIIKIDNPLPVGTYTVKAKKGSDNNTLLDYCDNLLPEGDSLTVIVAPAQPTPMDSIQPVHCEPNSLILVFRNAILCNTIAPNGSDFTISGPSVVAIKSVSGSAACMSGAARDITIQLTGPIQVGGLYTLTLKTGSDGNTLVNECAKETPAGSSITFNVSDTVSAIIEYYITTGCVNDTIHLFNNGRINIKSWNWTFEGETVSTQSTQKVYSSGTKTFGLEVSNGGCTDSSSITVSFDKNRVKAAFTSPAYVCPLDTAHFTDASAGPVISWLWDFGNGNTSVQQAPPYQFYPMQITLQRYTAKLTVTGPNGCKDTTTRTVQVPGNCYIAVPTAFTPNDDGLNDFLYPLNAYKAVDLDFKVYNRYGQLIWQTTDWTKKWDGRINGNPQASGTYVWHLTYTDSEKGKENRFKRND